MKKKRHQSTGEEIANSISHGLGVLCSIIAIPILIIFRKEGNDGIDMAAAMVFAVSMMLLYLASTLYHALPVGRAKRVFKTLDHTAIFLLIAGTYTPFAMGILRGSWGLLLFVLIWCLAILGIILEVSGRLKSSKISNTLYLTMGWSAILVIKPMIINMPFWGLILLLGGGISYSLGVYFYTKDQKSYFHFVWHIFVVIGSVTHFLAVLWYA